MSAAPQIIVVGSINTDLVIRTTRLPTPGETVLGGRFFSAGGGKGANQAVAAARAARTPVAFIATVGDDALGAQALSALKRENLECRFVRVIAGEVSGVALIIVDEAGQNQISVAPGANSRLSRADIDRLPESLFTEARVLLVSLETPLDTVEAALRRARRAGLVTILNPAPASGELLSHGLLPLVDVLTPNESEAEILGRAEGVQGDTAGASQPRRTALQFRALGATAVVVTQGAKGCLVVDDGCIEIAPHAVTAVDATAAGDAFNGVLAVALAEGKTLVEAARVANAAAAVSVTREGAQPSLPTRNEIEKLMR